MTNITKDERQRWVGASEVANLFYGWSREDGSVVYTHLFEPPPEDASPMGCVGYSTGYRMWFEKAGAIEPEDLDDNERIQAGHFLETAVMAWAQDKWAPWKLRNVRRYIGHKTVARMGASLDAEEFQAPRRPVEVKVIDGWIFKNAWEADGDQIVTPPMRITLQTQAQMACTGKDAAWIMALIGGNRLCRGLVEAHAPTIERIEAAVAAFWAAVDAKQKPDPVYADIETIGELYRDGDKSLEANLYGDNRMPTLASRYQRLNGIVKRAETLREKTKAEMLLKMGHATKAVGDGFKLSWPVVNREEKLQPEKLVPAMTYRGGLTVKMTEATE